MAAKKILVPLDMGSQQINNVADPSSAQDAATKNFSSNATNLASGTVAVGRLPVLVGDSGSGGTAGIVPAPASGDGAAQKLLEANGNWVDPTNFLFLHQLFE